MFAINRNATVLPIPLPILPALSLTILLFLSACGGGDGDGQGEVPGSIPPFNGPLNTIADPITFNANAAVVRFCNDPFIKCSTLSRIESRSTLEQLRIDPDANTVDIETALFFNQSELMFEDVFFTSGTTTFSEVTHFPRLFSDEKDQLKLLLPGPMASGFEWTSYGIWSDLVTDLFFGGQLLNGGAQSFGILSKDDEIPVMGSVSFTGFMDGLFVDTTLETFLLTGVVAIELDFTTGAMTGTISSISTTSLANFTIPSGTFPNISIAAEISGRDFSGDVASTGSGLSGSLVGSFYGPAAQEIGVVVRMTGDQEHMIGATAVRR